MGSRRALAGRIGYRRLQVHRGRVADRLARVELEAGELRGGQAPAAVGVLRAGRQRLIRRDPGNRDRVGRAGEELEIARAKTGERDVRQLHRVAGIQRDDDIGADLSGGRLHRVEIGEISLVERDDILLRAEAVDDLMAERRRADRDREIDVSFLVHR